MRKALTIAAACGLALGVAACGKHDDASSANVSAEDNMLVPADENSADAAMSSDMGGNAAMADNAMAAPDNGMAGNDMAGNVQ